MPPEQPKQNNQVPSIRTYKSDVAEFIKSEGKTLADIAIAETKRQKNILDEETTNTKNKKEVIVITVAILVILSLTAGALWFVLKEKNKENETVPINTASQKIFVSGIKEKTVSLKNTTKTVLQNEISTALKENQPFLSLNIKIENENGVESNTGAENFLNKIGIYPPGDLTRSLSNEFSIGSIAGKTRFLVLKTNYYSGAFAGMLLWEKNIANDLKTLLDLSTPNNYKTETSTSSQEAVISDIKPSAFYDTVISNRDARILRDGNGATILLYIFPDNETLIITRNENTTKIVTEKLLKMR